MKLLPVTEHIWMTPDFAADGQVCQMRFYPKRVGRDTAYLGGRLNSAELKWILNHIVPPASRGNVKSPLGTGNIGGGAGQANYEYEKVTFTFPFSYRIEPGALKEGELVMLDLDFPLPDERPEPTPTPASESDFDGAMSSEIVILRWNDRTCVQDDNVMSNEPRVAEIEQQFGQPQKIYSVGSFISMMPGFATDGQVCRMWFFPKRISGTKNYLGNTVEVEIVRSLLYALISPEQRGLKQEGLSSGEFTFTIQPLLNLSSKIADHRKKISGPRKTRRSLPFNGCVESAAKVRNTSGG